MTHGSPVNFSGRLYKPVFYGVDAETGRLDYDKIQEIATKEQPKLIIAGASAYSRDMDFERFRVIADTVGAILFPEFYHSLNDLFQHLHRKKQAYINDLKSLPENRESSDHREINRNLR